MPSAIPLPVQRQSGDGVLRALIDDASQEIVASVLPMFTDALRQIVGQVNAAIPQVNVAPAQVSAQNVINVPEAEVNVTVSLSELATTLAVTNNLLGRLIYLAEQPEITDVKRDTDKQITQMTRKRG